MRHKTSPIFQRPAGASGLEDPTSRLRACVPPNGRWAWLIVALLLLSMFAVYYKPHASEGH
jgi:hypothetical protein